MLAHCSYTPPAQLRNDQQQTGQHGVIKHTGQLTKTVKHLVWTCKQPVRHV